MKPFIKASLAAAVGVIIATVVCGILSVIMLSGLMSSMSKPVKVDSGSILKINLNGALAEYGQENPFASLSGVFSSNSDQGLDEMIKAIKNAKTNDNVIGIYINIGNLSGGISSYEEIRRALECFKESGKFVYAYIDQSCGQGAYYAGCVADSVFMNPYGSLSLTGLAAQPMFYTDVFKKIGVTPQVFKVGTYKSAVEPYTNTKMSDASREQTVSYMNGIWNNMLEGISASRGLSVEKINSLVDEFIPLQDGCFVQQAGLVDGLLYKTDMREKLAAKADCKVKDLKIVSIKEVNKVPAKGKKFSADKVAVLYAAGEIYDEGSSMSQGEQIVSDPLIEQIKKIQEDDHIKAVVLRVNSPGGSAYASEQICQAVKELKAVKPVVVSMGDYAASGGYYISSNADTIFAAPTTLTGSIGIFGLSFNLSELTKKVGLHFDMVKTNRYGDFGSYYREMTAGEKALMQGHIEKGYDLFVSRCAEGRHMDPQDIRKIAEGRVWTGEQALGIGLVDKLGYLDDAIACAAAMAGLEEYRTVAFPEKKDAMTQLMENFSMGAKMKLINSSIENRVKAEVKELHRRGGVLARMPYSITID